jgi:hypothetical protein
MTANLQRERDADPELVELVRYAALQAFTAPRGIERGSAIGPSVPNHARLRRTAHIHEDHVRMRRSDDGTHGSYNRGQAWLIEGTPSEVRRWAARIPPT